MTCLGISASNEKTGGVQVLVKMHDEIIPNMSNPHNLADLLTRALDAGGMLGMLALHAIFVLVTKHGLEYPAFYARMYQLLQPSTLLVSLHSFLQVSDVAYIDTLVAV
jgi:U3 small nucleolar RNA-associated protein 19